MSLVAKYFKSPFVRSLSLLCTTVAILSLEGCGDFTSESNPADANGGTVTIKNFNGPKSGVGFACSGLYSSSMGDTIRLNIDGTATWVDPVSGLSDTGSFQIVGEASIRITLAQGTFDAGYISDCSSLSMNSTSWTRVKTIVQAFP